MEVVNITRAGRRALRNDVSLTIDERLMIEIMAKVKDVTQEHLIEMFDELRANFGGSENALMAVKSGQVGFELVSKGA